MNKLFTMLIVSMGLAVSSAALASPSSQAIPLNDINVSIQNPVAVKLPNNDMFTINDASDHLVGKTPYQNQKVLTRNYNIPQTLNQKTELLYFSAQNSMSGPAICPVSLPANISLTIIPQNGNNNYAEVLIDAQSGKNEHPCDEFTIRL